MTPVLCPDIATSFGEYFSTALGGVGRGGAVVKDVNTEGSIVTSHEQHCGDTGQLLIPACN